MATRAEKALAKYGRALAEDREGGFAVTGSRIDAIYKNLATTTRGVARQLTAEQRRTVAAVERLAARQSTSAMRAVRTTKGQINEQFGGLIGSASGPLLAPVRAGARAALVEGRGSVGAAGLLARGNIAAVKIAEAGVAQAQAGAQYATAQALAARTQDDQAVIAQQQFELMQMREASRLRIEEWRKTTGSLAGADGGSGGVLAVANQGAMAFSGLHSLFNSSEFWAANQRSMTASEAATAYISGAGITDPNLQQVIFAVSTAMYNAGAGDSSVGQGLFGPGTGPESRMNLVRAAVTSVLTSMYPNYAKHSDAIDASIENFVGAVTVNRAADETAAGLDSAGQLYDGKPVEGKPGYVWRAVLGPRGIIVDWEQVPAVSQAPRVSGPTGEESPLRSRGGVLSGS